MKKEYGFTLAELLAVVVILGIITAITIPVVITQIDNYKTKLCVTQYDNILNAARSYGADHLAELVKSQTITLNDLNSGGYIDADQLKDPVTKKKISPNLTIKIIKIGKKYKYYIDDNSEIGCTEEFGGFYDPQKEFQGILSKEYTQGERVSYLGYTWLVMKDNGESTQLVMDGYLSNDELKANLPSDVASLRVSASGGMEMCDYSSSTYCNFRDIKYSWNKSIVKPTIENWLNSKMTEYGLTKEKELEGMAFSDGIDNINSYIRIPTKEEVVALETTCSDGTTRNPYCADTSYYMFTDYSYWLTTNGGGDFCYAFQYYNNSNGIGGETFSAAAGDNDMVRPVITVNEN